MSKIQILNRAKKTLATELKELKNISKIFNHSFYKAVILLSKIKGEGNCNRNRKKRTYWQ